MAGRFVFQEFASGMSRSTRRLSAQASASARATAPVSPRASEAAMRTINNRAAVYPVTAVPNFHAIHAARYLSTFPCSRAAVLRTGMPSTVIKKPTFLDSAGGVKRTCSSASNNLGHSSGAKLAAWRARASAWLAKKIEGDEDFDKSWWKAMCAPTFIIGYCLICPSSPTGYEKGCSGCCNCLAGGSRS